MNTFQIQTTINQAIRVGSCGLQSLKDRLNTKAAIIAKKICVDRAGLGQKELYLRTLLEVLKIALIEASTLVDFTTGNEDGSKSALQVSEARGEGTTRQGKAGTSTTTGRSCAYRNWDRHRKADDSSSSQANNISRGSSYSYYKDSSRAKTVAGEEGIGESANATRASQYGSGGERGSRESQRFSIMKPLDGELALPEEPPAVQLQNSFEGCSVQSILEAANPLLAAQESVQQFANCLGSIFDKATGFTWFRGDESSKYKAAGEKESSGFIVWPAHARVNVGWDTHTQSCSIDEANDSLCSFSPRGQTTTALADTLAPSYSSSYTGTLIFELSVNFEVVGTGAGFTSRFTLQAGESYSQEASMDAGFDLSKSRASYCSDSGMLGAEKARSESFSKLVSQDIKDRHKKGESSSAASTSLSGTSLGSMRFSGKSSTQSDKNMVKSSSVTSFKTSNMTDLSTAKLDDITAMKMRSISHYQHQTVKMINDLIVKTQEEINNHRINKAALVAPMGSTGSGCDDSPLRTIGQLYASRTRLVPYPVSAVKRIY